MERLKVGVVGLGAIGQKHVDVLRKLRHVELVAISDLNEDLLTKNTTGTDIVGYADYHGMLEHPGLEAVVIATPDQLHRDVTIDFLRAGKHVLVEKPIATTVEDGEAMVQVAKETGKKLMVGFTLRFIPHYIQAKNAVTSGKLGVVSSIFARRLNVITQAERLGGRTGVLHFLAIHDFDLLHWIIGSKPVSIYSSASTSVERKYPQENETFSIINFENGVVACAHIGWNLPLAHPGGRDFKLDIIGDRGSLNLDLARQGLEIYSDTGSKFPSTAPGLDREDEAFVNCVLDDSPVPVTGEDGIVALKMVLAGLESIELGRPVEI